MPNLWRFAPLCLSPLFLYPSPAGAETPTEVVVTANRFDAYRGDRAFGVVDIGADEMTRGGSVDEVLKRTSQAALFRRSSSLTANPTVQGIGLRAIAPSGAGRALVTLDGIPQNDPFGNWVIWSAIPQMAVAHGHVVRGAGGGAYGAGALTGVIDLVLTAPQALATYGRIEAGEQGAGRVDMGAGFGDLAVYAMADTLNGTSPVRDRQRGAADVATFGRDLSWLGNYQHSVCPAGLCGQLDILAGSYISRRDTGLEGASSVARGDTLSASFTRAPTANSNGLRLQVWRKTSDLSNISVSVADDRSSTARANQQFKTPATGTGFNAAIRHQTTMTEWEVGLDGRRNEGESRELYRYMAGAPSRYRISGGATSQLGVYGEGTQSFGPWALSSALRVDNWRSSEAHRTETDLTNHETLLSLHPASRSYLIGTGRLGLAYTASHEVVWRVAAYSGFRPPSLNELYRPFRIGNTVTEANADLKPETLSGVEFGVRHKRLIDADIFWNVVNDPIGNVTIGYGPATFPTAGFIPAGGALRQRQNIGRIVAYGLEVRSEMTLIPQLRLVSSGTWTHARIDKAYDNPQLNGLQPAQAPDYSLSIGLDADLARWNLTADLSFEGRAFDDDLNTLPLKPSSQLDVSAAYDLTPRLSVQFLARNALDARTQIAHASDGTLSFDTGRRLSVALIYR
ncbi:MAG: TonB-dependent receptor [Asticcacaulis sp.]